MSATMSQIGQQQTFPQMKRSIEELAQESARATDMLLGKTVARLVRHQNTEVLVEFSDGTRLFVDYRDGGLELSITEG